MWDGIGGECVVANHCVVTGILVGRVFVVVVIVGGRRGGKDDGSVRFSRVVDRDLVRRDGGPVGMDIDGMWHCLARKVRVVFHHVTPFDGVIGVGRCGVTSPPFLGHGCVGTMEHGRTSGRIVVVVVVVIIYKHKFVSFGNVVRRLDPGPGRCGRRKGGHGRVRVVHTVAHARATMLFDAKGMERPLGRVARDLFGDCLYVVVGRGPFRRRGGLR